MHTPTTERAPLPAEVRVATARRRAQARRRRAPFWANVGCGSRWLLNQSTRALHERTNPAIEFCTAIFPPVELRAGAGSLHPRERRHRPSFPVAPAASMVLHHSSRRTAREAPRRPARQMHPARDRRFNAGEPRAAAHTPDAGAACPVGLGHPASRRPRRRAADAEQLATYIRRASPHSVHVSIASDPIRRIVVHLFPIDRGLCIWRASGVIRRHIGGRCGDIAREDVCRDVAG